MFRKSTLLFTLMFVMLLSASVAGQSADCPVWTPGDPYKSENPPQLPDESGWDVNATFPKVLADDFMCGETGFIKDVHFWGSWLDGNPGTVTSFILSFHSDIPALASPTGYSMPGELLWEREITVFTENYIDAPTLEGWYDPYTGDVRANNHNQYMQYDVCLDPSDWFPQEQGTIYWLNISAIVEPSSDGIDRLWGWKSTQDHWNDDAVWFDDNGVWVEMYEPDVLGPISNDFDVTVDPQGLFAGGFGSDAFQEGWYQYPSGWLNIWFYDHPFDPNRFKTMHVEFEAFPLDPTGPAFLEFAVNWSTDAWSLDQLPGDSSPPLPGVDEARYIGRAILLQEDNLTGQHYIFDFEIPDYNPEWVSIDVRGFNFVIPGGRLTHQCVGLSQSLDLAFVITGDSLSGDPTGACCLPDGTCVDGVLRADCDPAGTWTEGVDCASVNCSQPNIPPVAKCQNVVISADANCEGCATVLMVDAGSYDPDGGQIVITMSPPCPYQLGSTLVELTVTDVAGATDKCVATVTVVDNTPPVPICPTDMTVIVPAGSGGGNVAFAISATDNCPGVVVSATPPSGSFFPVGVTTVIVVAVDAAGNSATCTFKVTVRETPPVLDCPPWAVGDPYKSENPPQLPDEAGWNVNATAPKTLADDFMCGETGYIKDLHFWGSWLDGQAGNIRAFVISFHDDIPAPLSPTGHSMPGKLLYERGITVFDALSITGAYMEGWYDPWTGEALSNNHQEYWQYDICLDPENWFRQEQGKIYWLNISAIVEVPVDGTAQPLWGWKSSKMHWNDDAVHLETPDTTCIVPDSGGTVHLPPDCPLVPQDGGKIVITEGLPPDATIEIEIVSMDLSSQNETEGSDGNRTSTWQTEMVALSLTGTGPLSGFSRTISLTGQGSSRAQSGDLKDLHPPGPLQSWDTEILSMDLSLFGDPDFDLLRLRAGSDFGLSSPGHTTATKRGLSGQWSVDSFFDITFEIEFEGALGGALEGMAGTTLGTISMGTDADSDESGDWREMFEPLNVLGPINNVFSVEVDQSGNVVNGFGEDAFGNGWYHYPKDQWWNVWFYDHPFSYNRYKTIHVEFTARPLVPSAQTYFEFALNWSTDAWSNDQPATDSTPPLPGVDEALYIGRNILLSTEAPDGIYSFDYTIDTYNPEWVSIDVRGFNFFVEGILVHECIGDGVGQSMDLAFVITGDTVSAPTGACCLPTGACSDTDAASCAANSGTYKGDGTNCSTANICGCCGTYTNGFTGNTDCGTDGRRNLADITVLIDHVYINKGPLCCDEEGNVDGDPKGKKNLADITALIDHVYINKPPTAPCQ